MSWKCHSMPSFFALPGCDAGSLEAQKFFLLYHGKGYTLDGIGTLSFHEQQAHVKRLHDQLKAEEQAHKDAVANAKRR